MDDFDLDPCPVSGRRFLSVTLVSTDGTGVSGSDPCAVPTCLRRSSGVRTPGRRTLSRGDVPRGRQLRHPGPLRSETGQTERSYPKSKNRLYRVTQVPVCHTVARLYPRTPCPRPDGQEMGPHYLVCGETSHGSTTPILGTIPG